MLNQYGTSVNWESSAIKFSGELRKFPNLMVFCGHKCDKTCKHTIFYHKNLFKAANIRLKLINAPPFITKINPKL
ncbi:hypothetical protein FDUTEX481_00944 [Tolypothrix sp. PCC 7601]|nr:hypothetical protein FDUTEX481_00944 [Tolypothrix sp. PCC 7601]